MQKNGLSKSIDPGKFLKKIIIESEMKFSHNISTKYNYNHTFE